VALAMLAVTGCATMSVSSHVQSGIDFGRYRTFEWGPADALPTGDPRLDKDPFFQDHMQGAVEKGMAAKGLARATAADADLLIHYHASVTQRIDINAADRGRGYCYEDCQSGVLEYEAGTIVLDLVDRKTNKVIWRGWAQESLDRMLDDQDRMERDINEAVSRMLARLPRPL
jgi:hypothetical protein